MNLEANKLENLPQLRIKLTSAKFIQETSPQRLYSISLYSSALVTWIHTWWRLLESRASRAKCATTFMISLSGMTYYSILNNKHRNFSLM